jgi:tryptophan-rich sensory protein
MARRAAIAHAGAAMTYADPDTNWPPLKAAVAALGAVMVAASIGSLATTPNIPIWYEGLTKPAFNPPNWVFAPVWSALYAMMAYAFYRILRLRPSPARASAIMSYCGQLALNALWSVVFFGLHSPSVGFLVVVSLWVLILLTFLRFLALDRIAGWLFAPYLGWVSFAALLNAAIWRLN